MLHYLHIRYKIHNEIPKKWNQSLFVYKKRVKKNLKNGKSYFTKEYAPLQDWVVKHYFNKNVIQELGPNHGHTVHGWRAGGITDLICAGLSKEAVSALSRHAINSKVFQRYIRFTPEHVANLVKSAKL